MNSLTELVFTAGLASLLAFLVLILPLLYLLSGSLWPWFERMAAARALDPGIMVVRDAPPARRTVSARRPARKLTVSPKRALPPKRGAEGKASAKPAKKKTAKKKAPAKRKAAVAKRKAQQKLYSQG